MRNMKKPILCNLTPARGQALLNFQGRIFPKKIELFETALIEEVRNNNKIGKQGLEKQANLNSDFRNLLIHGDCLSACAYLKSKDTKVDLVYIDPPFASGANYAKTLYLRNGGKQKIKTNDSSMGEEIMYRDIWQKEDYLNWIYERLLAIRDIMNEEGSIFVHLDWHIGSYVKILLDEIFGEANFINEIIWWYPSGSDPSNKFNSKHDSIFWYGKSDQHIFNFCDVAIPYTKKQIERFDQVDKNGKFYWNVNPRGERVKTYMKCGIGEYDVWNIGIDAIGIRDSGYTTVKPPKLLERIIKAASNEGSVIADFFIGSGTTAKVAQTLNRKFIGVDIGINAIQTTRDYLVKAGADFDVLKINDGVRLFRNPVQTTAKIFSLIDGFKTRADLGLGEFWDGGIVGSKGEYIPVKFIQIHDRLSKELIDVLLEEIYQLQDVSGTVSIAQVIYAHKDPDIGQSYINKEIKKAGKTTIAVDLISIDELLGEKADKLFMPDSANVNIVDSNNGFKVSIKRFFSPYLKAKIDEYNLKKVKKTKQVSIDDEDKITYPNKKVSISDSGLELIEVIQFDTTLRKDGVWISNPDIEDKAGIKDKIKAVYQLPTNNFKMKIRNIAGDEIILDSKEII